MPTPRTAVLTLAPSLGLVVSIGLGGCVEDGSSAEPTIDPGSTATPPADEPAADQPAAELLSETAGPPPTR
jgi:hypothetical protein